VIGGAGALTRGSYRKFYDINIAQPLVGRERGQRRGQGQRAGEGGRGRGQRRGKGKPHHRKTLGDRLGKLKVHRFEALAPGLSIMALASSRCVLLHWAIVSFNSALLLSEPFLELRLLLRLQRHPRMHSWDLRLR